MNKLRSFLAINEDKTKLSTLFLLMAIAYFFAVAIRFIWVDQVAGNQSFYWNNQLMINTNDGYMFAEGARDLLAEIHQDNDLSKVDAPLSILTSYLIKVMPFSFETVILYMPAFVGSLLVIPLLLIGRTMGLTYLGFIASLLAGITWSYYNRTMIGYFDTDMLIIVLPLFILWSLILGVRENRNRYLLVTTVTILLYNFWYPSSFTLNIAMAGTLFLYTILFERKNIFNYKLLLFMVIAMSSIPVAIQIALSLLLYGVFHFMKENSDKFVLPLFVICFIGLLAMGGAELVLLQLGNYIFRSEVTGTATSTLHYFNVVQTVREAGDIPFDVFANRISGHPLTFLLSTIGYILMVIRYPVMLIALPMVGLGFIAYTSGLRFTVYAVPINALGIAFLILLASKYFSTYVGEKKGKIAGIILAAATTAGALYPNIKHIYDYKVPTVFNSEEIMVLDKLKEKASREDYVLSWWDYGYPIRYYADVKTLIDGGKHTGKVNFPVSYALTYSGIESANMGRLITEYTERHFKEHIYKDHILSMMDDYGFKNPAVFLEKLKSKDFKLPEKTREVFYYLPLRMMNIYQTVRLFSNLDLHSGHQFAQPFVYMTNSFNETQDNILLGNGVTVNKKNNTISIGKQNITINSLYVTVYDKGSKLVVRQQNFNPSAPVSLVYMKSYNRFLVVDQQTLASTYFQLFVLENYDPELFEPVILSPLAKVYRLKK